MAADLSQSFSSILGQQQQQPDIAQKVGEGVQAGVQLATMQDQVEQTKAKTATMQEELQTKQLNGLGNRLKTAAYATSPKIRELMLDQAETYANKAGIPFDRNGFSAVMSDEQHSLALKKGINDALTGKVPADQALSLMGDVPGLLDSLSPYLEKSGQLAQANSTKVAVAEAKNQVYEKALGFRQQNQGDKIQLSANSQYSHEMKPAEQGLIAAHRADDLIAKVSSGELQANKTLRADLTSAMASLVSQGRPSTVYGQEHQEFDSAYQRVHDQLNFLQGDAKTTLAPKQLKQLKVDIDALRDLYGTQHETQYQSLREGLPAQAQTKLDARYNSIRKKYGLSTLDQASGDEAPQQAAQPPVPKTDPVADAFRAKAKAAGVPDDVIEKKLKDMGH